jgi:hypothetical protein
MAGLPDSGPCWHPLGLAPDGTAAYTITDKGELYGTRTVEESATVWEEKAFPNKP